MKIEVNSILLGPNAGKYRLSVIDGKNAWWSHFAPSDRKDLSNIAHALSKKVGGRVSPEELMEAVRKAS